ncbi:ribosomal-processing cysteine protease Prp [bacterium]|nr:ribosomal-processing cysteine protease Prp [bacterium]MBU0899399.1 ribosomal-processing cysteine protease Prp [bacterium]MBU1153334.1 ribosomal-processing cysteine protease Prp [bacterium]MBU1782212.1 ribosomal-processing cysteine protease Prp [bacterium]MBU2598979.1 ribosomal-processing cysteine protease Prp [bacterium]
MIQIKVDRDQKGKIIAFSGNGHAFYDQPGRDIVCSAVSTLFHHTILALGKYLNINLLIKKDQEQGILTIKIGDLAPELREKADLLLETLYLSLVEIKKQYQEHLEIVNS